MECKQPNEHGVYMFDDCENIEIPIAKSLKAELTIHVVRASDGQWRQATRWQFGYSNVGDGGGGSLPWHRSTPHASRYIAIQCAVNNLHASVTRRDPLTDSRRRKLLEAIEAFGCSVEPDKTESLPAEARIFYCGPNWAEHPLPDPNPMTLAQEMSSTQICKACPLATRGHVLVRDDDNPHRFTKYCTLTAIAHGLMNAEVALSDGQSKATAKERDTVAAPVNALGQRTQTKPADAPATIAETSPEPEAAPEPQQEQPATDADETMSNPEPPRPAKPCYIFGWMSAATISHGPQQLYVCRAGKDWGVTYAPEEAMRFKSVDLALGHYRKIAPGVHEDHEANIYNGHLRIFEYGPAGLRQMPRPTRQVSLFEYLCDPVEQQPALPHAEPPQADLFRADENKLLAAGFRLVRYDRENKTVQVTHADHHGWAPAIQFTTYAAAERTLKEMLQFPGYVEVHADGRVHQTSSAKKLYAAGFDFYRAEKSPGSYRIKQGSKNWGNYGKYEQPYQLKNAWDELMKDPKALRG